MLVEFLWFALRLIDLSDDVHILIVTSKVHESTVRLFADTFSAARVTSVYRERSRIRFGISVWHLPR